MSQVAGRAGRQGKQGKVIVQTGDPDHWVLQLVGQHDYEQFYENEIIERKNYHYPPYYKLISITLKHENIHTLDASSQHLADLLKNVFKERVIGPEYPLVQKIRNKFLKTIKLKIEKNAPDLKVKQKVKEIIDNFYSSNIFQYDKSNKMWSSNFYPENYKRPIKLSFDLIDAKTKKKILNKGDKLNFIVANKLKEKGLTNILIDNSEVVGKYVAADVNDKNKNLRLKFTELVEHKIQNTKKKLSKD